MSDEIDNPPAFPHSQIGGLTGTPYHQDGMTMRDYFASAALAQTQFSLDTKFDGTERQRFIDDLAAAVYQIADAMLKARTTR